LCIGHGVGCAGQDRVYSRVVEEVGFEEVCESNAVYERHDQEGRVVGVRLQDGVEDGDTAARRGDAGAAMRCVREPGQGRFAALARARQAQELDGARGAKAEIGGGEDVGVGACLEQASQLVSAGHEVAWTRRGVLGGGRLGGGVGVRFGIDSWTWKRIGSHVLELIEGAVFVGFFGHGAAVAICDEMQCALKSMKISLTEIPR
jgi:hypothetical protein